MRKDVVDRIEQLKNHTTSSLIAMQKAKVPSQYNLRTEVRYSYNEHGFYHSIYSDEVTLLLCENIPFNQNQKTHVYHAKLKDLVESNQVNPFLLFINNKFVKWDDIVIIKDCKYSYIMVLNCHERHPKVDCIMMPLNMRYESYLPIVDKKAAFIFNKYGKLIDKPGQNDYPYETIYIDNQEIMREAGTIISKRHSIGIVPDKKISDSSLIVFKDGELYTDTVKMEGLNIFSLPNLQFPYESEMKYRAFYHIKGNDPKDNIYNIQNKNYLKNVILTSERVPDYVSKLNNPFDFRYDRFKKYNQNIAESLDYIMRYNSGLMNEVYKERSNVESKIYSGVEMRAKLDDKGYMHMSKMFRGSLHNEIILFKNGLLFERYNEIKYVNKDILIPIGTVQDDDVYEFLIFKDVDNRITEVFFPSTGNDIYTLDSTIDLAKCKLFTMDVRERDYNLERKPSVQYEIDFEWKRVDGNRVRIIPKDSFYYDRHLRFASKRQFRYNCLIAKEETIDIELSDDFNCCNDKDNFLVFVNGRRVDNSNFKVTTIRPTRPFDDVSVFVNLPVQKGQKIEVFCLPDKIYETVCLTDLELTGDICLNKSIIDYNLSKDLYFIFINGKKINNNQMVDISQDRLRVITDSKSTKNVSVIKHIDDDAILKQLFDENEDILTETIKSIPPDELNKLYKTVIHTNTETDFKEDEIPMKSVMYEIVEQYWMRPYINDGTDFVFDFDDEFKEYDSEGTIVVNSASVEEINENL